MSKYFRIPTEMTNVFVSDKHWIYMGLKLKDKYQFNIIPDIYI